jgi:hypothetical protein
MGDITTIIESLKSVRSLDFNDIFIHHTMGLNINTINKVLALNDHQGKFWVHDYYSLCPSYNLLRNDYEYCGAPDINSNACTICKYGELRRRQQMKFKELFQGNDLQVIAPSKYTLNLWKEKIPYPVKQGEVRPICSLNWKDSSKSSYRIGQLHIGFLGYPLNHKGWKTWIKVVDACNKDERFVFYHFSSLNGTPGDYQRVHTAVSSDNPTVMTDSLRQYDVDAVLLWANWPETFSITLHEALAAGCFILTNKKSGNIQDYIQQNPNRGVVLENDADLLDFVLTGKLARKVEEYQRGGRPRAELEWRGGGE